MRIMKDNEIKDMIHNSNWATICTVSPSGIPYAVEATYFIDGESLGFMINPRGQTMRNLTQKSNLLLKITQTNENLSKWAGVSLFGIGKNITDPDEIQKGWNLLGKVMNTDYTQVAKKFINSNRPSPYLRCEIIQQTGRCNS